MKHDYTLSDEFMRNHFLVGLLLQEVKSALTEIKDIRKLEIVLNIVYYTCIIKTAQTNGKVEKYIEDSA